ncbi:DMT family transporter [Helicobacter mustelae]|uniref:Spermidine export protein MdtJ n=1 Tax=Helicobacter mustelae (strain ATCC 43772 / CCUG 25715 / CIP 103759 / LMG 18044 / NCTC 12198 / R85-136P) TaxID=679897 RepID=D3UJB9_HELM1|nr:SMR family transporter [Helicobacter mustelae]CBG40594.1 putative efflux protein (Multidrug resistance protein) [Helicobacter mustelae 12198]SQH72091.1 multidrug resistance efflux protein [Helicobacter mustelae]STP13235.1 multidrug resistance efflux protein [Helicobacter mustelae]
MLNPVQKSWIFLILAIVMEVLGSGSLRFFEDSLLLRYGFMAGFIMLSYFFMGLAIKRISIGLAYAMWEALGIILISLIGAFCFDEVLSLYQKLGIGLGILGIVLIHLGDEGE